MAINLMPDAWGLGLGTALLAAATQWLGERHQRAILWVVVANARARHFYEREGWRYSGDEFARVDTVEGATVTEARYERNL